MAAKTSGRDGPPVRKNKKSRHSSESSATIKQENTEWPSLTATTAPEEHSTAPTHSKELPENSRRPKQRGAAISGLCEICNANQAKYKCPRCLLTYCSVPCNKQHQENHPLAPDSPRAPPSAQYIPKTTHETPAADPTNPFSALDNSPRLQALFQRYPHLPDRLLGILQAMQQSSLDGTATRTGPQRSRPNGLEQEAMNRSARLRNGRAALRRARNESGEDGEAIREYSALILQLLSDHDEERNGPSLLQRRVAMEDDDLLRQLVAADRGSAR